MDKPSPSGLRFQIIAFSIVRTITNTAYRMIYPFLPTIARGLGVDLQIAALAVTARSGLGLLGPLFGPPVDRHGRKVAMLTGLMLGSLSLLLISIWPTYPALLVVLILSATGKIVFDTAMQAYLGERVHYERRGLAIAVTEMGWSGAFLLGIPVVGWLIERAGWRAPFPVLSGLWLAAALLIWRLVPPDTNLPDRTATPVGSIQAILARPAALAGLAVGVLISSGNEVVNIVYGAWMEDAFALRVATLGVASTVIGLAELGGEGLVAGITDRLGKRRAVALGIGVNLLTCFVLPLLGRSLGWALVGLFSFYISFEYALVSSIALMTELAPEARATLMASNLAAQSAGRMVGSVIGPLLFGHGLMANAGVAIGLDLVALVTLLVFVRQE